MLNSQQARQFLIETLALVFKHRGLDFATKKLEQTSKAISVPYEHEDTLEILREARVRFLWLLDAEDLYFGPSPRH